MMASRHGHSFVLSIGLVFVGGSFGAATREWLRMAIPAFETIPVSIAIINVIGAFLLGYLYEALTRLDSTRQTGKNLRLLLGTGYCGGFTTYSSLATDTAVLLQHGFTAGAIAFALGTVVVGAAATWLGIVIASIGNNARAEKTPDAATQTGDAP